MITVYQTSILPIGHFDIKDSDLQNIKGGEVLVMDTADSNDLSVPDVYKNGGRAHFRIATKDDIGPFFFANSDKNTGQYSVPGFETTSLYNTNPNYGRNVDSSSKISVFADEGFYSVGSDVIDSTTVNANTAPNTRLYVGDNGYISATPSHSSALVGFFIEYRTDAVLNNNLDRPFYTPGSYEALDSVIIYKANADGYLNLDIASLAEAIGSNATLGTPTDGYFSDGLFPFTSTTTIADATDSLNEALGTYSVASIEERNGIDSTLRYEGYTVYVEQTESHFILKGGITNSDWYLEPGFDGKVSYQGLTDYSSVTNIYVSATGNDVDGYGTSDAPYRQVQRAMQDIPVGASGDFRIYCGPGTFKPFHFVPVIGRIYVIGSTENPVATTFPTSSGTLASGKYARRQLAMTGGWVDTITDVSHWVLDINNIGDFQCRPVDQSTTPTLNIVNNISSGTTGKGLYPYETVITDVDEYYNGLSIFAPEPTLNDVGRYYLIGLELTDIVNMSNVNTMACKFNCSNHYYVNYSGSGYLGGVIDGSSVSAFNILSGSNVSTEQGLMLINGATINVLGGRLRLNTAVLKDGSKIVVDECGSVIIGLDDFESNASVVLDAKGRSQVNHLGNCSVSSSPTTLLKLSDASYRRDSGTFIGDTSGVSIVLENGGQAIGISNSTSLTSSGAGQIQVGAGTDNFADLPITDAITLCRAT